jgi:hypothetical protein
MKIAKYEVQTSEGALARARPQKLEPKIAADWH